jgi:hypothetical protein
MNQKAIEKKGEEQPDSLFCYRFNNIMIEPIKVKKIINFR